jgi:NCS2 family nucleobase:cation symporter-2
MGSNLNKNNGVSTSKYDLDGKPPLVEAIPLGLQHVLAMFAGNVTVPIVIAGVLGLASGELTFLIQAAMFVAGVTTILQANKIGPVGANLPIVMGTSFGFMPTIIAVGPQYGLAAILGASFVGGIFQAFLGYFLKPLRKLFPPIVTGTVLLTIGLSLLPTGIMYAAGGAPVGGPNFGSFENLFLAGIVLATILVFNQFTKGFMKMAAILAGIIVGYLVAIPMGKVSFAKVGEAAWFAFPAPLQYGLEFHWPVIAALLVMYVVTTVETIGDISGITVGGAGREATDKELQGGIIADGLSSSFAAIFNALPNTSYSQNVGIVSFTKVMSRYVVTIGGIFLIFAGMVPKLGAVVAAMPMSVLGGAAIIMFAMIATSGIVLIGKDTLNQRNLLIVAVSLGLGLGFSQMSAALQFMPDSIKALFAGGIVLACFVAIILNQIFPKEEAVEANQSTAFFGK